MKKSEEILNLEIVGFSCWKQLALSGILSLYACQSSYLGTFLWTYPFALKVDLSELARAESKFVFVKRSLLLVLSSFILLHQESSEMSLETCFCFCTKGNLIILKILEMSLVLYVNFALEIVFFNLSVPLWSGIFWNLRILKQILHLYWRKSWLV